MYIVIVVDTRKGNRGREEGGEKEGLSLSLAAISPPSLPLHLWWRRLAEEGGGESSLAGLWRWRRCKWLLPQS